VSGPIVKRRRVTPRQVLGVRMLEWHQLDRMRESGREAARRALEQAPERVFA
jgi:hypothetical protein